MNASDFHCKHDNLVLESDDCPDCAEESRRLLGSPGSPALTAAAGGVTRPYAVTITVEADSPLEAMLAAGDLLVTAETVADLAALGDAIAIREVML